MSDNKYKLKLVELDYNGNEIDTLADITLTKDDFWKLILEMMKVRLNIKNE